MLRLPGGKFSPGQSGNVAGKPKGTVDKRTELKRMMADGGESIVRVVLAKPEARDLDACSMVLARIAQPARSEGRRVSFSFDMSAPLAKQAQQVVNARDAGELSVDESHLLVQCLANAAGLKAQEVLAFGAHRKPPNPSAPRCKW